MCHIILYYFDETAVFGSVAAPHQGVLGQMPYRNTFALAAVIYQYILTALACATNDLSMPRKEQRTGARAEERGSVVCMMPPRPNSVSGARAGPEIW